MTVTSPKASRTIDGCAREQRERSSPVDTALRRWQFHAPGARPSNSTPTLMAGKFLIDLTDARFSIAQNEEILAFVRVRNPFAHSDVGSLLFAFAKEIRGAQAYCPAATSYAYVVLHTSANVIFAIAFDQRSLAFRLAGPAQDEALGDAGVLAPEIGADWVRFRAWQPPQAISNDDWLRRWAQAAFDQASAIRT